MDGVSGQAGELGCKAKPRGSCQRSAASHGQHSAQLSLPRLEPMRSMHTKGKPHLVQLANSQQQDPVAKAVSAEVTAARGEGLGWSHSHALKQGRVGGLIEGSGRFTLPAGQQHFQQLLSRIRNSLRLQPSFVTRYPTLAGLLAPEDSDDSQEQRQVAEEQVYEWLRVRMTQRQQENGKKAGECPLMEEKMGKICVQTLLPFYSTTCTSSMIAGAPPNAAENQDVAVDRADGGQAVICKGIRRKECLYFL